MSRKSTRSDGFTLIEVLVATALMAIVLSGLSGFYLANKAARISEELSQGVESQLRLGMERLLFGLRSAGYGVPKTNLAAWVSWVSGITSDPLITAGIDAAHPDTVAATLCTSQPVAHLAQPAVVGQKTLVVALDVANSLDVTTQKMIYINDSESAALVSVSSTGAGTTTYNIDTNPSIVGPQGLTKAYAVNSPICRVDVITYSVDTTAMKLLKNENHGAGDEVIMDGITNMKIAVDASGQRASFQVTLTGRSSQFDPLTHAYVQRSLTSTASVRN